MLEAILVHFVAIERVLWAAAALVPIGIGLRNFVREGLASRRPKVRFFVAALRYGKSHVGDATTRRAA